MKTISTEPRISTGISNLDAVLSGGIPVGALTVLAGSPGSGKTTLSQQIIFHNATPETPAIFFQTLSEPTAKTLRYLKQFEIYDQKKIDDGSVTFVDLGEILRNEGLEQAVELLMGHIKKVHPAFVVIDSFKVFEDLAPSREHLRKFSYEVAINLMAWECTTLFLGEFAQKDIETNPLFSIIDGIITLKVRQESGETQRFLQVAKMRGTDHSRDEHSFAINSSGIELYAPRVTIKRIPGSDRMIPGNGPYRAKIGISKFDTLLGKGIPYGSTVLVSGVAGTGKTLLLLEFIYRGAKDFGEKGILFSFEETEERLVATAKGMGWDIDKEIKAGNIEIIFIPQPDILVEKHLLMIKDRIDSLGAKRIAIDSASVFVHKIKDQELVREKIFQLGTLVQMAQGIGFFSVDIPYGTNKVSRFGVEETVVDGIILLTATINEKFSRERFIEIYKLRNTAHLNGRHSMLIEHGGINVIPRPDLIKKKVIKKTTKKASKKKK